MEPRKYTNWVSWKANKAVEASPKYQFAHAKHQIKEYACECMGKSGCSRYFGCTGCTHEWLEAPWC